MKSFKSIIFILCFILISCKNDSKEGTNKQINDSINYEKNNIKKSKDLELKKEFKIDVLGLSIGDTMPEKIEGYKLIKSVKTVEEGNEEPIVIVVENGSEVIELSFAYDNKNESFTNKIGEILIFSDKFRASNNIGVNSTIEDFIANYSKYFIWYSYISNIFVIETEKNNIQFLLDESSYTGKSDLYESDMVKLKKEDFIKNTKIKAIRIY
jgi:hypothetical protein